MVSGGARLFQERLGVLGKAAWFQERVWLEKRLGAGFRKDWVLVCGDWVLVLWKGLMVSGKAGWFQERLDVFRKGCVVSGKAVWFEEAPCGFRQCRVVSGKAVWPHESAMMLEV